MKDKKGDIRLRDFLLVLVFFGLIISGFTFFLADIGTTYNQNIEGNYSEDFAAFREISSDASNYSTDISKVVEEDVGWRALLSGAVILGKGIISAIKLPFQIIPAYLKISGRIFLILGIPPWVQTGILSIIFITITYTIVQVWRRRGAV